MKIAHLCTMDTGGAAIAAQRLHKGLLKINIDSACLFSKVSNRNQHPNFHKVDIKPSSYSIVDRIKRKLGFPVSQLDRNRLMVRNLQGKYEIFSFPYSDFRVEEHPLVRKADIVHLHWVANFINYPTFFNSVKKPIVWTLHDMNPLLGGFHYDGDKIRNKSFAEIEKRLADHKASILKNLSNITVVAPSMWISDAVKSHETLSSFKLHTIPYGLDLSIFKPIASEAARSVLNIPLEKKVVLFVSEKLNNYRKGFDLLAESLKNISGSDNYLILAIGECNEGLANNQQILPLGPIYDSRLMSIVYSCADVLVLPSREDNFPNVMLESMACGTPVIAYATGGMKDVIEHGANGILVNNLNSESLHKAIETFLNGGFHFDREKIRNFALAKFDLLNQANRYNVLYESLL